MGHCALAFRYLAALYELEIYAATMANLAEVKEPVDVAEPTNLKTSQFTALKN